MRKLLATLSLSFLIFLQGCATIFGSSSETISIESEPSGASVYLRDSFLGKTPLKTEIPKRTEATFLTFKKEGYDSKTVQLGRSIAGAAFLNLFFLPTTFGATSWGVDAASGKLFNYDRESYAVELQAAGTKAEGPSQFEFVMMNHEAIREDLAHGHGETFEGLCRVSGRVGAACAAFQSGLVARSSRILRQPHALALYRSIR